MLTKDKPLFIAEVSSNHHQDLSRCIEFIDVAAAIGCDGVKFQLFKIEELFAKEILENSEQHRARKKWELPLDFIPKIAQHCKAQHILFGCTPFYLQAVKELENYIDFYKIASYELTWLELIKKCALTGKPLVLSTGMANLQEIESVVQQVSPIASDLTILQCVSGYPTPSEEAHVSVIETLNKALQKIDHHIKIGWSDHTVQPGVLHRAIHRWSASLIEFHLDLDGKGDEFKTGHCWLPEQIQKVIEDTHCGIVADGRSEKTPTSCELADRNWRADPSDGLRPFKEVRKAWKEKYSLSSALD